MKTSQDGLIWSVRALAQSAESQKKLFPPFVVVADELALTFEEHYKPALSEFHTDWSTEQIQTLLRIDEKLETMSGQGKEHLWLTEDCLDHAEWSVVRSLAREALISFRWPTDQPPQSDAVFISGKKEA